MTSAKEYQLLYFENNKIILNENTLQILSNINTPVKILSIIGEARQGKSSLLNAILTQLEGKNCNVFVTSDTSDHCTHGINLVMYLNYIFLDCQGIQFQDSSNDINILLFPYLISNLMVYNCNSLNNTVIKALEPITCFCNFIDVDNIKKPSLIFRVKDYNLIDKVDIMLNKTLESRNDQYDRVRTTINTIFNKVKSVSTNQLDRIELKYIKESDYIKLLNNDENNFVSCITFILNKLNKSSYDITNIVDKCVLIQKTINSNSKLDHMKLDTYTTIVWNEILEYISTIDNELLQKIQTDGLQSTYDNVLERRIYMYHTVCETYSNSFKKVEHGLFEKGLNIIKDNQGKLIYDTLLNFETIATKLICDIYLDIFTSYIGDLNSFFCYLDYYNIEEEELKHLLNEIQNEFLTKSSIYYKKVIDIINNRINSVHEQIIESYKNYMKDNIKYVELVKQYMIDNLKNICCLNRFDQYQFQITARYEDQPFHQQIIKEYINYFNDEITKFNFEIWTLDNVVDHIIHNLKNDSICTIQFKNYIICELKPITQLTHIDHNKIEYYINLIKYITYSKEWIDTYNSYKIPLIKQHIEQTKYSDNELYDLYEIIHNNEDLSFYEIKYPENNSINTTLYPYIHMMYKFQYILLDNQFENLVTNVFTTVDKFYDKHLIGNLFTVYHKNNYKQLCFLKQDINILDDDENIKQEIFKNSVINNVCKYHEEKISNDYENDNKIINVIDNNKSDEVDNIIYNNLYGFICGFDNIIKLYKDGESAKSLVDLIIRDYNKEEQDINVLTAIVNYLINIIKMQKDKDIDTAFFVLHKLIKLDDNIRDLVINSDIAELLYSVLNNKNSYQITVSLYILKNLTTQTKGKTITFESLDKKIILLINLVKYGSKIQKELSLWILGNISINHYTVILIYENALITHLNIFLQSGNTKQIDGTLWLINNLISDHDYDEMDNDVKTSFKLFNKQLYHSTMEILNGLKKGFNNDQMKMAQEINKNIIANSKI